MPIHTNGMKAEHLIPLLEPLLHTLSGVEDRPGNRHAMRNIRLFCTRPMKFEKGAKRGAVNDTEWLRERKQASKPTWLSRCQGWVVMQPILHPSTYLVMRDNELDDVVEKPLS